MASPQLCFTCENPGEDTIRRVVDGHYCGKNRGSKGCCFCHHNAAMKNCQICDECARKETDTCPCCLQSIAEDSGELYDHEEYDYY